MCIEIRFSRSIMLLWYRNKFLLPLVFSVLLLLFNLPQADATLCGDTVDVVVKDANDMEIFSTSGVVGQPVPFQFGDTFAITPDVDVTFTVQCDGSLTWDYINTDNPNPYLVPEHSIWWNDLMWTRL